MQTIPTATTSPAGQPPQPSAAAKPGSDASIFAALIQALTGTPAASTAPATPAPGELDGEAGAATPEGEADGREGEGLGETDLPALVQLPGLELPVPPLPAPRMQIGDPATASAGTPAPQIGTAASPGAGAPVPPSASSAEPQTVPPPSAQAVELAKALGASTQVHVTTESAAPPPPSPVVGGAVVAAALQEAPAAAAAAEPLIRAIAQEPKKAPPVAGVASPAAGEATKTSETAAAASGNSTRPAQQKVEAAPTPAAADADGAPAIPAPSSSLGSASPTQPEATAPEAGAAAAKGSESQATANQPPAFASTAGAQPAAAAPDRAAPPMFPAPPPAAGQVSVHIAKAVRAGVDRIDIQLAPASLGRVEIALDLSDSQQVRATISAESKEALELLRGDARVLERALNDAGLKTDPGSLSFQLRDHGARAGHDGGSRPGYGAQPQAREPDDPPAGRAGETPAPAPVASRGHGRIDIHA
jgi:hypothetical protein